MKTPSNQYTDNFRLELSCRGYLTSERDKPYLGKVPEIVLPIVKNIVDEQKVVTPSYAAEVFLPFTKSKPKSAGHTLLEMIKEDGFIYALNAKKLEDALPEALGEYDELEKITKTQLRQFLIYSSEEALNQVIRNGFSLCEISGTTAKTHPKKVVKGGLATSLRK